MTPSKKTLVSYVSYWAGGFFTTVPPEKLNVLVCVLNIMCMHIKSLQSCPTLSDPMNHSLPGSCPWDSLGKDTGVGCHMLLQGIFPTQGSNPRLFMSSVLAGVFFTTGTTCSIWVSSCYLISHFWNTLLFYLPWFYSLFTQAVPSEFW